ncbi:beta-class carbonic anhydrase [Tessaracoccus flavus]|jgi:carbonic anhydrase|uniref:carbonic anhydrase n=1 Tax=Tessaracoccus flavus TaxID=1610493 RepID=A0A1Q2CDY4_9ACTN|nr:carbonic anhydrase [Tessaracoccus flavus]AQP44334.1 carbonic anhydrase [Tessaracoccus flavus]SDY66304.1 carbonic anhydrase [Tessaracoccus flavus]
MSFDDLLQANASYAENFEDGYFDGIAKAGVAIVTCMDSRIEPLGMVGLRIGDAKILRSPGGRVSTSVLNGCVLSVQLLQVDRIMIIPHTRCAMASGTDDDLRKVISAKTGTDASWLSFGASPDQAGRLRTDVDMVSNHPLIKGHAEVGGFLYDVDTGLLKQII